MRSVGKRLADVAVIVVVLTAGVTAVALAARWSWLAELATHFPLQWSAGAALALTILLIAKRGRWSAAAGVVLIVNLTPIAPLYWNRNSSAPPGAATYYVLSANVHAGNRDMTRMVELVRRRRPDVLFLTEVNAAALTQLGELDDLYPHRLVEPRSDAFGCALFSRWPLRTSRTELLAETSVPTLLATIELDGRDVVVIGAHPPPPISVTLAEQRNRQLRVMGQLAAQCGGPLILLGDLNTTSWSPAFQDLLRASGLRDSRVGFGLQPSWPNVPWMGRIPIDHILVTDELRILSREVGPDVGSDHLPVQASFFLDG